MKTLLYTKLYTKTAKLLAVLLTGMVLLNGCGRNPESELAAGTGKLTIVTSFYPVYLHTINITRDIPGVEVVNMTQPQTGCLHDYQLTPDNMRLLEKAQIFVVNGAGMESFMDKVLSQLPGIKVVEASRGMKLLDDEHAGEKNPHVWVSISGAIEQVGIISEQLAELDGKNAEGYRKNAARYTEKLEVLKTKMHSSLDAAASRKIVTFHEAFAYFAEEFGLETVAVIEREPGSEPGAAELAETIEKVKAAGVKALFAEPQYDDKAARTIARETGAQVYMLDPVVTGDSDKKDYDAYIRIMENNLKVLQEALM